MQHVCLSCLSFLFVHSHDIILGQTSARIFVVHTTSVFFEQYSLRLPNHYIIMLIDLSI